MEAHAAAGFAAREGSLSRRNDDARAARHVLDKLRCGASFVRGRAQRGGEQSSSARGDDRGKLAGRVPSPPPRRRPRAGEVVRAPWRPSWRRRRRPRPSPPRFTVGRFCSVLSLRAPCSVTIHPRAPTRYACTPPFSCRLQKKGPGLRGLPVRVRRGGAALGAVRLLLPVRAEPGALVAAAGLLSAAS